MLKWLFSKKQSVSDKQPRHEESTPGNSSAFFQAINEKRNEDPLIGAKIGAKEIFQRLAQGMKDEKGVHAESLLCALGAVAGYSCQAGIRSEFIEGKGLNEQQVFVIIGCAGGSQYFFGDMINKPLAENRYSVWSLAAGAAQHMGLNELIDLEDIFKHVSQTVGSSSFGVPRIPDDHKPGDLPQNYLKHLWPVLLPIAKTFCPPAEWPLLFGLAVQEGMHWSKDVIDPALALSIVMESAVPMAKVDFNSL